METVRGAHKFNLKLSHKNILKIVPQKLINQLKVSFKCPAKCLPIIEGTRNNKNGD